MINTIGFRLSDKKELSPHHRILKTKVESENIQPCIVKVFFPERNVAYAYFNDCFSLSCGDTVFVDGAMENKPGKVTEIQYCFKINIQDYKRVLAKADTEVKGDFFLAGSHLLTFDRNTLPYEKIRSWFKAPTEEPAIYSYDDKKYPLFHPESLNISENSAQKGHQLYIDSKVIYISLEKNQGKAIVKGGHYYEIEFRYENGDISNLTCDCFCVGACKHQLATMLQLRETLNIIEDDYPEYYKKTDYFATVNRESVFGFLLGSKFSGKISLD